MKYTTETTHYLNRIIKAAVDVMASSEILVTIKITNHYIEIFCDSDPVFDLQYSGELTAEDTDYICNRLEKLYKQF